MIGTMGPEPIEDSIIRTALTRVTAYLTSTSFLRRDLDQYDRKVEMVTSLEWAREVTDNVTALATELTQGRNQ